MGSASQQLVQWLGQREAPSQLSAQLKARGLAVNRVGVLAPTSPARLTRLAEGASVERPLLTGRRVAVLSPDPAGADEQAQALRSRGAQVAVLSLNPEALARFQSFDPDAVLVQEADFIGGCWEVIRALWHQPRLRWTPVLLAPADAVGRDKRPAQTDAVCQAIQELCAPYDLLIKQAGSGREFDVPLSRLGPARTLRALSASGAELEVRVESGSHAVELHISEGLVADATEIPASTDVEPDRVRVLRALGFVLAADHGRILVKGRNVMAARNSKISLDDVSDVPHATRSVTASGMVRRGLPGPSEAARRSIPVPPPRASKTGGSGTAAARVYPLRPQAAQLSRSNARKELAESGAPAQHLPPSEIAYHHGELPDIWDPSERQSLYQAERASAASTSLEMVQRQARELGVRAVSQAKRALDWAKSLDWEELLDWDRWLRLAQRRARRMSPLSIILTVSAVIAALPLLAVVFGGPAKARSAGRLTVRTERSARAATSAHSQLERAALPARIAPLNRQVDVVSAAQGALVVLPVVAPKAAPAAPAQATPPKATQPVLPAVKAAKAQPPRAEHANQRARKVRAAEALDCEAREGHSRVRPGRAGVSRHAADDAKSALRHAHAGLRVTSGKKATSREMKAARKPGKGGGAPRRSHR